MLYKLRKCYGPWGDYSSILIHGMTAHLGRKDGLLQLERTGPFVPPISFPGFDIVVTAVFRQALEASGLTGLAFKPVKMARIVHLNWHQWDLSGEEPPEYPKRGGPENYILARPHSPQLAEQMSPLWEVCLEEHAVSAREKIGREEHIFLRGSSWDGTDFFHAEGVGYECVSERAKEWLEQHAGEWVRFEQWDVK